MKRLTIACFIFCLISQVIADDGSVDDLFDEQSDVEITQTTEVSDNQNLPGAAIQENQKIKITGSIATTGGIFAEYNYLPWDDRFTAMPDFNAGLTASSALSIEAHPDIYFSYYASFMASIDPLKYGTVNWSDFTITALYCEYIWLDTVFWKLGKYSFIWGQGRLFAPGNLVSDSSNNYTIMATLPTLFSGSQLFMQFSNGQFGTNVLPLYETTIYGAKTDIVVWDTYIGLGGRWKPSEDIKILLSLKKTIFGIDIHSDSVTTITNSSSETEAEVSGSLLFGFYKQWSDFHLYGEFLLADISNPRYDSGLVMGYNNIFKLPVDPVIKWMHCWSDGSGYVSAGIKWDAWPYVKIEGGVSLVYGADSSVYVAGNTNPNGQRFMFALIITLSGNF